MTSSKTLPHRPRLADAVMLRRHLNDGEEHLALYDTARSEVIEIDAPQLAQLDACDGTRDIGGVVLACVRKGVYRRFSALIDFLSGLHQRGMLTDGIAVVAKPAPSHPERPLAQLPGYRLVCDENGSCCATYSSLHFTAADARRAMAAAPDVLQGAPRERVFLPLNNNHDGHCSVTLVNGRCAFLADDNACRIHRASGSAAKPAGCRSYPATFVDDGQQVRVSVGVECACVLSSVGAGAGAGMPLAPEGAACEAHLLTGTRVVRLPDRIAVAADREQERGALRAWSDAVVAALPRDGDALACAWALAGALTADGLDVAAAKAALTTAQPPSAAALAMRLMALAAQTGSLRASTAGWRSERDRSRRLCAWLDDAAQALMDQREVTRLLKGPAAFAQDEWFYLRAAVFGHQLVVPALTLAQAFRDRATRMLLARQAAKVIPEDCRADPSARYPLTAVEAMMRGQGLAQYAVGLP